MLVLFSIFQISNSILSLNSSSAIPDIAPVLLSKVSHSGKSVLSM